MSRYLALIVALNLPFEAEALADRGTELIEALDEAVNRPTDTFFRFEALTQEPGKDPRTMIFSVENKGPRRLVSFEAPGDMKGTRVLVLSRQQMYVYLPAYNKVRRVASHVTQQGFMGTTYSDEDMSTTRFAEAFDSTVKTETDGEATVNLAPKPGAKSGYARLEMVIRKDLGLPSEIRYYSADGQHVKTETRTEYDCGEGACTPGRMKMTDHTRGDVFTVLLVLERRVNTGIQDSVFSVRTLERGR